MQKILVFKTPDLSNHGNRNLLIYIFSISTTKSINTVIWYFSSIKNIFIEVKKHVNTLKYSRIKYCRISLIRIPRV